MDWSKLLSGAQKVAKVAGTVKSVYTAVAPPSPPLPKPVYASTVSVAPPPLAQGSKTFQFPLGIHTISPQTKSILGFAFLAVVGFIGLKKFKVI